MRLRRSRAWLALGFAGQLLISALASAQIQPGGNGVGGASVPNFNANGGLPHWRAARNAIKTGTATKDYAIIYIGESQGVGNGCVFNGLNTGANFNSDEHSCSLSNLLANALRLYGVNVQTNNFLGAGNVGSRNNAASYDLLDWRINLGNWVSCSTSCGTAGANTSLGGQQWFNTNTTAATFTPTDRAYPTATGNPVITTDTIDVWTTTLGGANLAVTSSSGGSTCTVPGPSVGNAILKTTCSFPSGNNTYTLTCPTAFSCAVIGANARLSTKHEITIWNGAIDGATASFFTTNTGSTICSSGATPCPWDPLPLIEAIAPVLCIIQDVENDAGNVTPIATYKANLTAIAQACMVSGDVLFLNGQAETSQGAPDPTQPYQTAVLQVATALNQPSWDLFTTAGGPNGSVNGFFYNAAGNQCCGTSWDEEHFSAGWYMFQAVYVSQILML